MKKIFVVLFIFALASACVSQKTVTGSSPATSSISSNDGSSFEKAILINEKSETAGVNAEYVWLRKNYPGHKVIQQSLANNKNVPYDIIKIVTSDGQNKNIYFNISKFFGKF
jgi:hypothetical protein